MSKAFRTEILMDARPETVWSVLVDTAKWPEWDPYCERIEGTVGPGAKMKAFTKLAPGRGFSLDVTELEPARRMIWSSGMPLGLFKGERTFELEPEGAATRFRMAEVFTGPMLVLIGRTLPDLTEPFDAFAEGLKARSEQEEREARAARLRAVV